MNKPSSGRSKETVSEEEEGENKEFTSLTTPKANTSIPRANNLGNATIRPSIEVLHLQSRTSAATHVLTSRSAILFEFLVSRVRNPFPAFCTMYQVPQHCRQSG